jgi:uncharacterized protein (TIGR03083 family)
MEAVMDVWDAVRDERLDLAERLNGLDAGEWDMASLCHKWRIRDVLAHVTAGAQGAYGVGPVMSGMVRHGFSFSRWMADDGRRRGEQDPTRTLRLLEEAAGSRKSPPGAPTVSVLTDVMIHGQDICRPLGLERNISEEHLIPVAGFVQSTFVFGAKKRTAGLKLCATDMDWSHGDGPEVTGTAEALVMAMAGRKVALGDLAGEGKAALASRY